VAAVGAQRRLEVGVLRCAAAPSAEFNGVFGRLAARLRDVREKVALGVERIPIRQARLQNALPDCTLSNRNAVLGYGGVECARGFGGGSPPGGSFSRKTA
jgi:hypothetical protein